MMGVQSSCTLFRVVFQILVGGVALSTLYSRFENVAVTAHNPFAIDFQRLLIVDIIDGYEKFFVTFYPVSGLLCHAPISQNPRNCGIFWLQVHFFMSHQNFCLLQKSEKRLNFASTIETKKL